MKAKKLAAAAAAAMIAITALSSCGTSIIKNEQIDTSSASSAADSAADVQGDVQTSDSSAADTENTQQQVNYDAIEVPYVEYKKTYQAESGTIIGDTASVKKERASFKGDGYVTGANQDNWSLSFDLPESQFYNITVQTAADKNTNCRLYVNGKEVWVFRSTSNGTFEERKLENIWLDKGINEITIRSTDDAADIDYVTIEANKDISALNPDLSAAKLSNANADYNAKALYSLICSNYGKQILTAQHDSVGSTETTDLVATMTEGKYPAMRWSEIGGYTRSNTKEVTAAKAYAADGGIVAYDWYWLDPAGGNDFEVAKTNFDIKKAVPEKVKQTVSSGDSYPDDLNEDQQSAGSQAAALTQTEEEVPKYSIEEMAIWTDEDIEQHHGAGDITDECYNILKDIDKVSSKLKALKKADVAVLWRPLPVASNGLYWWGTDKDSYKWLWQLMYTRMTVYHELNNLVWIWSAQNADWYVGDEYCDVLSADVYSNGNRDAQINTLLFLNNICKTKPLGMSECGNLPAMESVLQEKAYWSFTALWSEPYLGEEIGVTLTDTAQAEANAQRFKQYYNNNYTLTRDELPNLKDVAANIKAQEKADAKADKTAKKESDKAAKKAAESEAEN